MDSVASPRREAAWAGKSTWEPWETVGRILPGQEQLWVQRHHFHVSVLYPHTQSGMGWRFLGPQIAGATLKKMHTVERNKSVYLSATL